MNNDILKKIQNLLNTTTEKGASEAEAQNAILLAQKLMAKHGLDMADIEASSNDKETKKEVIEGYGTEGFKLAWWHKSLANVIANNFRCYYFMRSFYKETRIVFMGLKEDVEIAKSIFKFASAQIEYHARKYRKNRKKELEEQNLPEGFKDFSIKEVIDYASRSGVRDYVIDGILRKYDKEAMQRKYLTIEIKEAMNIKIDGPALRNDYIRGFIAGLDEKFREQVEVNKEEWGLVLVKDTDVVERYNELSKNFRTARASKVSSSNDASAFNAGVKQGKKFNQVSGELE